MNKKRTFYPSSIFNIIKICGIMKTAETFEYTIIPFVFQGIQARAHARVRVRSLIRYMKHMERTQVFKKISSVLMLIPSV